MDIIIVAIFVLSMILFFLLQLIFLRFVDTYHRVSFLLRAAGAIGFMVFLVLLGLFLFQIINFAIFYTLLFGSEILFGFGIVLYVMTIFSFIESSITIKILSIISQFKYGMTRTELKKVYNTAIVVDRRLQRFVDTGELQFSKKTFIKHSHVSAFSIRDRIIAFFEFIYP